MTGGYDDICQPLVVDERFDYVLFSDQHIGETLGVWKVHGFDCEMKDFVKVSRYPKILPHLFLSDYRASLYHDANITIKTQAVYDRVLELANQKILWAGMNHPFHDCIYDELYLIPNLGFEHDYIATKWGSQVRKEGMPRHAGFFENNIIFRTHTDETKRICELWWNTMLKVSRRDQFTLRYVLWKMNIPMVYIFPKEQTPRNSPNFCYIEHNVTSRRKLIKMGIAEIIRRKTRLEFVDREHIVKEKYFNFYKTSFPLLYLNVWGICNGLKYYFPNMIRRKLEKF